MHTAAAEEAIQSMFLLHDEVRDGTMEQSHHQSQGQSRKVRYHALSLAIDASSSIRGSA